MLKKSLILIALFVCFAHAEDLRPLTSGTITQNIQFTDLNGNEYDLFEILESGKHMYVHFSADW